MNTAIATLGSLSGEVRVSASGNFLGNRFHLTGPAGNVSDIKAEVLRANPNLKGKALKSAILKVRKGEAPLAWVSADVAIAALRAKGAVPVVLDTNKKGDKFAMKFEVLNGAPKTEEEKKAEAVETLKTLSKEEQLKALGYSEEQIAVLMAL